MSYTTDDVFRMDRANTWTSRASSGRIQRAHPALRKMVSTESYSPRQSHGSIRYSSSGAPMPMSTEIDDNMDFDILVLSNALHSSDLILDDLLQGLPPGSDIDVISGNQGSSRNPTCNDAYTCTGSIRLDAINDVDEVDGITTPGQRDEVDGMSPAVGPICSKQQDENHRHEPQEFEKRLSNSNSPIDYSLRHGNQVHTGQLHEAYGDEKVSNNPTNDAFGRDKSSGLDVEFRSNAHRNLHLGNKMSPPILPHKDGPAVDMELCPECESDIEDDWFGEHDGNAGRMQTTCMSSFTILSKLWKREEGVPQAGSTKELRSLNFRGPTLQELCRDYDFMLEMDTPAFVRTIFRAVKLNQIGVVKMLCRITKTKGYTLNDPMLREHESSATVLHLALLNGHKEIAYFLMEEGGSDLIKAPYTHTDYKNKTAIHVAAAKGNAELVETLLTPLTKKEKQALLNTVATGTYFDKHHPDGQLCTTAAAWAGHGHILETLVKHGANLTVRNAHGDTLLHRIVIMSEERPNAVDHKALIHHVYKALEVWVEHGFKGHANAHCPDQVANEKQQKLIRSFTKLMDIQNNDGLTPMALAAMLASPILVEMMNLEHVYKLSETKLGSPAWLSYDVTDVTSYTWNYYNGFSVLHILSHLSGTHNLRKSSENLEAAHVLDTEPLKSILQLKWSVYRLVYIVWCLWHILYIACFSYLTFGMDSYSGRFVQPDNHIFMFLTEGMDSCNNEAESTTTPVSLNTASTDIGSPPVSTEEPLEEIVEYYMGFLIITPIAYLVTEFIDLFGNRPYAISNMKHQSMFFKLLKRLEADATILGNWPYRLVLTAHSIMAVVWFCYYVMKKPHQELMLSASLFFGWIFIIFFTRGCRYASHFSVMLQKMFFQDLLYFLVVWLLVMLAFIFSLSYSYGNLITPYLFAKISFRLLNTIIDIDIEVPIDHFQYPVFCYTVLILYAVFTVILLLNMLIAMMNTSYEVIKESKGLLWKQQQLSIMLMLERRLLWCKWLCRLSERKIWYKEGHGDIRAYLDVTTANSAF